MCSINRGCIMNNKCSVPGNDISTIGGVGVTCGVGATGGVG